MAAPEYHFESSSTVTAEEAIHYFAGVFGAEIGKQGDHPMCYRKDFYAVAVIEPAEELPDSAELLGTDQVLSISFYPRKELSHEQDCAAIAEIFAAATGFVAKEKARGLIHRDFEYLLMHNLNGNVVFDSQILEPGYYNDFGDMDQLATSYTVEKLDQVYFSDED
ncbi:hypothetical protein [Natronoglycomyces albus]|uniref:Uncharacterized protein n=1 Tax=Natronoglycomyces albus TaxID=2811108 RepID=A0A895XSQ0_9ACTN|nr:hypothetical protein [Natronoglycomyces albus]QSB06533.1 hypothetical protein JQS30_06410 [Natronoglycomyces albus]